MKKTSYSQAEEILIKANEKFNKRGDKLMLDCYSGKKSKLKEYKK